MSIVDAFEESNRKAIEFMAANPIPQRIYGPLHGKEWMVAVGLAVLVLIVLFLARKRLNRWAGQRASERIGALLVAASIPVLAYWAIVELDASSQFLLNDLAEPVVSLVKGYDHPMKWLVLALAVGILMRFALTSFLQWLKSGSIKSNTSST